MPLEIGISMASVSVLIVTVPASRSEKKSAWPASIEKGPTLFSAAIDSASPSKYSFVGDRAMTESGVTDLLKTRPYPFQCYCSPGSLRYLGVFVRGCSIHPVFLRISRLQRNPVKNTE